MKKTLIACAIVVIGVGSYLGAAHLSGGAFFAFGLPLGAERGELRRTSLNFMEDVQFKDFKKAASYHAPEDQANVDIPFLIWRLFKVKPEVLDIMSYDIAFAELDKSKLRARIKLRIKAKELVKLKIREQELMLYFSRANESAPWYMKFEDSLRNLKKDEGKEG